MKAIELARHEPVTVTPDTTLIDTAVIMDKQMVGAVVVVEGGSPTGIVTDRDIAVRAVAHRVASDSRIDNVMTTPVTTLDADAEVADALAIFRNQRIRRLPLVRGGQMVGMLTLDDLLLRTFDDLSDLLLPVTMQVLHGRPQAQPPATTS